ncbi:MAG: energy-coupled thiamine transporter ThiT [Caldisericales bacterium]|jgi:energy-coupled thiamine transporter ThiT|nr:energy-coupled thiamine transporter ThiT [bacterium]
MLSDSGAVAQTGLFEKIASYFNSFNFLITLAILAFFVFLIIASRKYKWDVHTIAIVGICSGLSLVFGYFPFFRMPEGGSISLAMVPVVVVALTKGVVPGVITGVIAGCLQYFPDPFFYNLPQFLLDYPIAWGLVGLAGLWKIDNGKKTLLWVIGGLVLLVCGGFILDMVLEGGYSWDKFVALAIMLGLLVPGFLTAKRGGAWSPAGGVAIGAFARFLAHLLSGMLFFYTFAWPGYSILGYTSIYIAIHLVPETILCMVAAVPINKYVIERS